MRALKMKNSKGITEYERIIHKVEEDFFLGLENATIFHSISGVTVSKLLDDGFDILIVTRRDGELRYYEITWRNAEEGRRGKLRMVTANDSEELERKLANFQKYLNEDIDN